MLSALLLIGLAALCASLIAALFAAYPAVVLPFLLHVLIAWMLGRTLRKDATTPPWLAIGVATTLLLAGTAILTAFPRSASRWADRSISTSAARRSCRLTPSAAG